jgi:RsiW-degrading membrane proteinase PrsW (M82 family)
MRFVFERSAVTRNNVLYLVIGALAVAVGVLSYQLYRDRHQPEGVHIELGPGGLSIQGQGKK